MTARVYDFETDVPAQRTRRHYLTEKLAPTATSWFRVAFVIPGLIYILLALLFKACSPTRSANTRSLRAHHLLGSIASEHDLLRAAWAGRPKTPVGTPLRTLTIHPKCWRCCHTLLIDSWVAAGRGNSIRSEMVCRGQGSTAQWPEQLPNNGAC